MRIGHVGAPEYRSRSHPEIHLASVAAVEAVFASAHPLGFVALRSNVTIGPEFGFEMLPRRFGVREHFKKIESAYRASAQLAFLTGPIRKQALLLYQTQNEVRIRAVNLV